MYYRQKLRNELGISRDAVVLLSVGELNENKNHQIVIRALEQIKNPKIHYVIVGQGGLFAELNVLAENAGLTKQVHLLGYRDDVPAIYQAADVFVFPSKREGLSVALMEAIACKILVICTDIRGNTDLVKSLQWRFSAGDREALIKCIESACGKGDDMRISDEFKQSAEKNFRNLKICDLENVMRRMRKIYWYKELFSLS